MKLLSLNIENNLHTETVLSLLRKENPDVICFQELLEEDFEFYKKELQLDGIYQPTGYIGGKVYSALVGKKQGIGIFAKNIVDRGSLFYFGSKENISKSFDEYVSDICFQNNHAFVWVDMMDKQNNVHRYVTTHLPVTEKGLTTPFQLSVVDSFLKEIEIMGQLVFCGDMNAPRGGEAFSLLSQKYTDCIPLEYKTSIDQNLHRHKGLQYMVDGLFTTPVYKTSNVRLVDGASDHMAIVAEIHKN